MFLYDYDTSQVEVDDRDIYELVKIVVSGRVVDRGAIRDLVAIEVGHRIREAVDEHYGGAITEEEYWEYVGNAEEKDGNALADEISQDLVGELENNLDGIVEIINGTLKELE